VNEPEVDLVGRKTRDLLVRVHVGHGQGHARQASRHAIQQLRQDVEQRRGGHAHAQRGVLASGGLARPVRHRLRPLQQVARFSEKHAACVGELDLATRAKEQLDAQFLFQRLDLLRKRGLRHVQPLGRAHEAQRLGHRHEVLQLPQVHQPVPSSS
jgi:hypothetical protein